ncbi:MAG TPA: ATP-dependent DNA helicase RecG [Candidatus Onthousia faecipullorum]|uniref:ATP-dependent DNA helicase RecG n=1 Tax=Candidatus Onthousia faecipullorum TaxID=2840887 RepID=A0A9D1G9N2_9FIRM|nr:ATP-dependent DNA helicase RecG [Candidatus Onthousia faecipullorum]
MALKDIKGVGPRALTLLSKIGINTVDDLVTHYPFRYEFLVRGNLEETNDGDHIIIDGKIESSPILVRFKAGLNKMNFRLVTASGVVGVSIFNRAFLKSQLTVGTTVTVIGKFDKSKNVITASEIKMESLSNKVKIEPVYHLTSGLTNKNIALYINMALLSQSKEIHDSIPLKYQEKYNFSNKRMALNIVHNPPSKEKLKEAMIRLKYEELFEFMFKINYLKEENKKVNIGIERNIDESKVNEFISKLPYELTKDQVTAVNTIIKDLKSKSRMNRLLQGDVGSGKTIVSFIAMYANYLSGYQSALMAPTEILATQHFSNLKDIFANYNLNMALLTGSTPKKEKDLIYEELKNGDIDIIVGTHALIQEDVTYHNLGLVITDEQHRFGVNQRANLQNKGQKPDTLYMSATPIPRTYALTIYGDMDVSTIKTRPKGRKKIKTVVKTNKEIKDVLEIMYEELKQGHQIYVIAPLIEESENSDLTNVNDLKEKMTLAFGSKYKIDLVHGKMASAAKELIMNEFLQNKVQILISTTVIEVGVDVPNATMMVIFNAERFGLSTLHQLRGRVGRSELQSSCILISDNDTKRLEIMENTNDGFEISEEDFKLRGHGDLFGTKQSGDMTFKIADLKRDYKILLQAREDSLEYLLDKENDANKLRLIGTVIHS